MSTNKLLEIIGSCDKFKTETTHTASIPIWKSTLVDILKFTSPTNLDISKINYSNKYNEVAANNNIESIYLPAIHNYIMKTFKIEQPLSITKITPNCDKDGDEFCDDSYIMVDFIIMEYSVLKNVERS